jgi:NAD(P)-dependent dehydrogenase (short-subunit alcohol dehydrogenase family)
MPESAGRSEPADPVIGAGRVAVVTGAASGIGRALAEAFSAAGSAVVLADLDGPEAESVGERLRANGADALAVTVDVSDPASVESLAQETVERFGRVDVLCNNAGVSTFNLIQDQTLDDWHWVFNVNLWGVVHGLASFLPILRAQSTPSHIVNTASMGGLMSGVPFIGPYAATKTAVVSISETLRQECAAYGLPIGVSVLCPSTTNTRVMESERGRPATLGTERRTADAEAMRLAIKSMFTGPDGADPEDVAERTLAAIRAGEFWIIPNGGERPIVEARFAEALAGFPVKGEP